MNFVNGIKSIERILGSKTKKPYAGELKNLKFVRKFIVVKKFTKVKNFQKRILLLKEL